jgi:tRNA pseudouridine55 synthase
MIFAVYKPIGPSSRMMVDRVKRMTRIKKVGHAGTLDPLARGVLVVAVGRSSTKQLGTILKNEKEYVARIRLGMTSTTDDEDGEKTAIGVTTPPSREQIKDVLPRFIGHIEQTPPAFSAIKTHGSRAYRLARRGQEITLLPRIVEIKSIELLRYEWPLLTIRVTTGAGAYIRALARDIGAALGVGGYINDLERTRVGEWTREQAISISWNGEKYTDRVELDDRRKTS